MLGKDVISEIKNCTHGFSALKVHLEILKKVALLVGNGVLAEALDKKLDTMVIFFRREALD
jgi:hypothetical protein